MATFPVAACVCPTYALGLADGLGSAGSNAFYGDGAAIPMWLGVIETAVPQFDCRAARKTALSR